MAECERGVASKKALCCINNHKYRKIDSRSQWPCGLRRRSTAAPLLRSWVRIPSAAWMFVCCKCCVLSDRGLCDGLITRPEESYRLWRVVVCDQETSNKEEAWKIQPQSVATPGKQANRKTDKLNSSD